MASRLRQINQFPAGSTLVDTTSILGQTVGGKTEKYPASLFKKNDEVVTYGILLSRISNKTLVPYHYYFISDKNITVQAKTTTEFFPNGIYEYYGGKRAWGVVSFTGTSGSVNSISVGGENILTNPVSYSHTIEISRVNPGWTIAPAHDTSMLTFTQYCANLINDFSPNYNAYAIANYLVIESRATGVSHNGLTITVTTTNMGYNVDSNLDYGEDDLTVPVLYSCCYDVPNNIIISLYDQINNNFISQTKDFQISHGNSIFSFNFNNPNVKNHRIMDCVIYPNFLYSGAIIDNVQMHEGEWGKNIVSEYIQYVNMDRSLFTGNVVSSVYGVTGLGTGGVPESYQPYYSKFTDNVVTSSGGVTGCYLKEGAWFNNNYVDRRVTENSIGQSASISGCKFLGGVFSNNWFWHRFQMINVSVDGRIYNNIWHDDGCFSGLIFDNTSWIFSCIMDNINTFKNDNALLDPLTQLHWSNVKILKCWLSDSYLTSNLYDVMMLSVRGEAIQMVDKTIHKLLVSGEKSWLGNGSFTIEIKMDGVNNGAANSAVNYSINWDNEVIKNCEVMGFDLVSTGDPVITLVGGTEAFSTNLSKVNNKLVTFPTSQLITGITGTYNNTTKIFTSDSPHNLTTLSNGGFVVLSDNASPLSRFSTRITNVVDNRNILLANNYGADLASCVLTSDIANIHTTDGEVVLHVGNTAITGGHLQIKINLIGRGRRWYDIYNNW